MIHLGILEEALCYMLQHTQVLLMSFYHSLQDQPQRAVPLHSPAVGALVLLCASFTEISFGDFLGLVPKAPKAPSPFFVSWVNNAEFIVKVM